MLPLALFRSRTFSLSTVIGLLINICFYGLIFVFSLLFQREQHLSPLQTGLALAPIMIAITAANLTRRPDRRPAGSAPHDRTRVGADRRGRRWRCSASTPTPTWRWSPRSPRSAWAAG